MDIAAPLRPEIPTWVFAALPEEYRGVAEGLWVAGYHAGAIDVLTQDRRDRNDLVDD